MGDFNDAFMRNNAAGAGAGAGAGAANVQGRVKAQNRANVMQLKLVLSPTPNSRSMFNPRAFNKVDLRLARFVSCVYDPC